jgi:hypothetical protein
MSNAWISWVKKWAKDHNISYGCAISDIDCVAEYRLQKEDAKNKQERKKATPKLKPPSLTQPMDLGQPSTIPIYKNIQINPRPVVESKKKRGRPVIHQTAKEKYDAKLLSNKLKRREKREESNSFPTLNLTTLSSKAPAKQVKNIKGFFDGPMAFK